MSKCSPNINVTMDYSFSRFTLHHMTTSMLQLPFLHEIFVIRWNCVNTLILKVPLSLFIKNTPNLSLLCLRVIESKYNFFVYSTTSTTSFYLRLLEYHVENLLSKFDLDLGFTILGFFYRYYEKNICSQSFCNFLHL